LFFKKLKILGKPLCVKSIMVDESLHCLFDIFDQDKTGYLERNELKSLLIALGESSSDSRIDRLV
jgi:Ca2+-binding EF-hand superfamily protein